ncbi:MAG: methyltransferase domain-containing protein [Actinobacteria bacterium]|nr:methyltransferase domain-containing protein [Actinomycetota bacterium]
MRGRPGSWSGVGAAYAASYAQLCRGTFPALRDLLGEGDGRTLLDVGAGTGELGAGFAAVGWTVTAREPEPSMRDVAARRHPELRVKGGELPALPDEDGAYDAAVANFVLNHVADPRAAAAELRRVARGSVAATIWTESPSWLWAEVCDRAGLVAASGGRLPAEKDFERSVVGFAAMLGESGWPDPRVHELRWVWRASKDVLWTSIEGGIAGAGAYFRALDVHDRGRFRAGFEEVVAARSVDGLLPLEHAAAVGTARLDPPL